MSLAAHLIHTCTVQRAAQTLDRYGNASTTWRDYLTNQPCRLVEKTETVASGMTAELVTVTTYTLLVDSGVDIVERDRVSSVLLSDGATAGPFIVRAVLKRHSRMLHHKSVALDEVH